MPGTRAGGLKAAKTNKLLYGEDFYNIVGAKGGRMGDPKRKGFAADRERARRAGRKGGAAGRSLRIQKQKVDEYELEYEIEDLV